jgi:hypothetical protein
MKKELKPYCTIDLTEEDAQLFMWFKKYQPLWEKLSMVRGKTVFLNIDDAGTIASADLMITPLRKQTIFEINFCVGSQQTLQAF